MGDSALVFLDIRRTQELWALLIWWARGRTDQWSQDLALLPLPMQLWERALPCL